MPPGASRCCPCTTPSPTTAASSPSPTTDSWRTPRWARAARVGIRAAARSASTPSAAWCPTGSRRPRPTGPGCWPGGPNSPRPTSAWPPATASTSWTSTAPPAPRPSATFAGRACTWRARGRWSGPAAAAGISIWPRPAWATSVPATSSRWTGGAVAAMSSPHPAATPPATPTTGSPAGTWTPATRQVPAALAGSGCSIARPTDPPRSSPSRCGDRPGPRYGQAALAQELARVATAPKGQRNRQLWEAARNLYNLVATGALDHQQVHQGLLQAAERCGLLADEPRQTQRTLASGRQVGLAHPRPAPDRTRPDPTHASPPPPARTGGERTQEGR